MIQTRRVLFQRRKRKMRDSYVHLGNEWTKKWCLKTRWFFGGELDIGSNESILKKSSLLVINNVRPLFTSSQSHFGLFPSSSFPIIIRPTRGLQKMGTIGSNSDAQGEKKKHFQWVFFHIFYKHNLHLRIYEGIRCYQSGDFFRKKNWYWHSTNTSKKFYIASAKNEVEGWPRKLDQSAKAIGWEPKRATKCVNALPLCVFFELTKHMLLNLKFK